jgi:hypothetical protein
VGLDRDVAGGDNESVDGGEEGNCRCFFRLRKLYVRWTLEDINFDARAAKWTTFSIDHK